jgi:hypothetical protein
MTNFDHFEISILIPRFIASRQRHFRALCDIIEASISTWYGLILGKLKCPYDEVKEEKKFYGPSTLSARLVFVCVCGRVCGGAIEQLLSARRQLFHPRA